MIKHSPDGWDKMFNPTAVVAASFGDHIAETYLQYFSGRKAEYAAFLNGCARMMLERLGNSDALYHNAERFSDLCTLRCSLSGLLECLSHLIGNRDADVKRLPPGGLGSQASLPRLRRDAA